MGGPQAGDTAIAQGADDSGLRAVVGLINAAIGHIRRLDGIGLDHGIAERQTAAV